MKQKKKLAGRVAAGLIAAVTVTAATATVAMANPTIVSVGDSAISGEAGRWAGNSNRSYTLSDTGADAYSDGGSGEAITGCHRSKAAEVHIGGMTSVNFACSGSMTHSYNELPSGNFKPGLDFQDNSQGKGQLTMLQDYATAHPHTIKAVAVLVGADDFGFADVAKTCVADYILSSILNRHLCQNDYNIQLMTSAQRRAAVNDAVAQAYHRVYDAMTAAHYKPSEYRIIAETYPSVIPSGGGFRYPENANVRQTIGGCGVYDADATYINNVIVPMFGYANTNAVAVLRSQGITNVDTLDLSGALTGHRLCEGTAQLVEDANSPVLANGRSPGASDQVEWVQQVRATSSLPGFNPSSIYPYQEQEFAHPSYWGQLAMRNCLRYAYNNGAPRSGSCSPLLGNDAQGEPNMSFLASTQPHPLDDTSHERKDVALAPQGNGQVALATIGLDSQLHNTSLLSGARTSGWSLFGGAGTKAKKLVMAQAGDGSVEAIMIGLDDQIWHSTQSPSGTWTPWYYLSTAGNKAKDVQLIQEGDGKLVAVMIGTDDQVWVNRQTNYSGGWTGWNAMGTTAKKVVLQRDGNGNVEVVTLALDGTVSHDTQNGQGGWTGWAFLSNASNKAKDVVVEQEGDGRLEAVMIGLDDQVWHNQETYVGGGWTGWNYLSAAGNKAKKVILKRRGDGLIEAIMIGLDDQLWHNAQTNYSGGWTGWNYLSNAGNKAKDVVMERQGNGLVEAIMIGLDDQVWHNTQTNYSGGWTDWHYLSGAGDTARSVALVRESSGKLAAVRTGLDDTLSTNEQTTGNGWTGWLANNDS